MEVAAAAVVVAAGSVAGAAGTAEAGVASAVAAGGALGTAEGGVEAEAAGEDSAVAVLVVSCSSGPLKTAIHLLTKQLLV